MTNYILCSKDMSEVPENICKQNCKECNIFETIEEDCGYATGAGDNHNIRVYSSRRRNSNRRRNS